MHAQEVYLHPYCLVVTRLDKIHIPALGHTCFQPPRGVLVTELLRERLGMLFVLYCGLE